MEDAKTELQKLIKEKYSSVERSLDSAMIYEISDEFELEVQDYYTQLEKERQERCLSDNEKREREEFEKLKLKYGS